MLQKLRANLAVLEALCQWEEERVVRNLVSNLDRVPEVLDKLLRERCLHQLGLVEVATHPMQRFFYFSAVFGHLDDHIAIAIVEAVTETDLFEYPIHMLKHVYADARSL